MTSADDGLSGTQAKKRPQFLKMIQQCKKGKIDMVLTKSISRFARNTVDCLNYVRLLKMLKIAVIFEKENINTMTAESEMMIAMMGAFAQAERESISANVTWGQREGMKKGNARYNFKQWYGYEKGDNGTPQVVHHEGEVVERIYRQFLSGDSLDKIKKALEQEKIPTKKGGEKWSKSVIKGILNNEKYCGDVIRQKTFTVDCLSKTVQVNNGQLPKYLIKNCHPAIVSREIYDCVQAELARRNSKRKISNEIKALQKVLEDYKLQRQAVTSIDRQLDNLCETLGSTTLEITEYADKIVRQLIDTIKVMGGDKLLIIFKGGFEMEVVM